VTALFPVFTTLLFLYRIYIFIFSLTKIDKSSVTSVTLSRKPLWAMGLVGDTTPKSAVTRDVTHVTHYSVLLAMGLRRHIRLPLVVLTVR
jgi:hypothetical protein